MLYFAYGSNLDSNRIRERCESAEPLCTAVLKKYKLVFVENNSKRIVANIVPDKDEEIHGVIYEIDDDEVSILDMYEGHPSVYRRSFVEVKVKGKYYFAQTYMMDMIGTSRRIIEVDEEEVLITEPFRRKLGKPSKEYFQYLINGYKEHKLPIKNLMMKEVVK